MSNSTVSAARSADSSISPDREFASIYKWTEADRALLEKLQDFIPEKVFDAHAHMQNTEYLPQGNSLFRIYGTTSMERFLADQKELYGNRKFRALILPTPSSLFNDDPAVRDRMNAWLSEELYRAPDCVGAVYVVPGDTVSDIESMLTNPQIRGFKCYHLSAETNSPTWEAEVGEYLPESAWQVADRRGMSITVHMVKEHALSDEKNMTYFRKMTGKYPNAKLILAHCARGFASWTAIEAVRKLKGIPNLYYDMAAITDAATMFEVIRQAGPDHVMWGTDYCIDRAHGKAVNCGDSFRWIYAHKLPEDVNFPVCKTVLESLLSFWQASLMLDLSEADVRMIFYGTACRLFGLEE